MDDVKQEIYRWHPGSKIIFGIGFSFVILVCIFLFKNPFSIIAFILLWLFVLCAVFFRAPLIIISGDGTLCYKHFFDLHTDTVNLLELSSVDVQVSGKGYRCILTGKTGSIVKFQVGFETWIDEQELMVSIQSAATVSGATYLNHASRFLNPS